MTIRELKIILDRYHPEETVICTTSATTHNRLQITGVNEKEGLLNQCLVLSVDWLQGNSIEETQKEKLERQRRDLDNALILLEKQEKEKKIAEELAKKPKKKKAGRHKKKKKTVAEQLAAGLVPTGRRGRPRKQIFDNLQGDPEQSTE